MSRLPFSKIRYFILLTALLILAGGSGYRLGERRVSLSITPEKRVVVNTEAPAITEVDFGLFWDVWEKLRRYYIEPASLDAQKMVYGAISGMVSALGDPYTTFLPPKENKEFKEDLGGEFEGIGAQLGLKDARVVIIAPLRGTPAEKAGLRPNDAILKVNDEDTAGWTVPQAVAKIRGLKGTSVTLTILHENQQKPIEVSVVRATITVPSVEWWVKTTAEIAEIKGMAEVQKLFGSSKKVAYLRLSRFGDNTNGDWNKAVSALAEAEQQNGKLAGLILDLRNNPGGYLDGSVFIGSEFIKSGVIVTQVNSDGSKQEYTVSRRGKLLDIPLIVLVNKGSASASEIVAGALKDHRRATVVGETSFGKGSVQTPFDLAQGAGVHITTGKWLLPKGDSISQKGVAPDVEVKLEDGIEASRDAQLAKAVELLLK